MSREISADFDFLKDFFDKYELRPLLQNADFLSVLSQQHKKYYSYLTLIAEIIDIRDRHSQIKPSISSTQLEFFLESCSDIGSSIFVMANGSYKAAKMMQRSSIETFLKAFTLDVIDDIDKEKSMFALFDKIKEEDFFSKSPQNELLNVIHQKYKLLCQDVHTASSINMNHISALKYFPTFSKKNAEHVSDTLLQLVSSYNTLIGIKYTAYFPKMHHRNRENILENVPKKYRQRLQGLAE